LALKVFSPHLYPTVDAYDLDMHRIGRVASIVAGIDQGNVLNVQRFETFEGVRLMLMKQVEGYDLRTLMDKSSLDRVREVRPDLWDEITKVIANFGPVHAQFTPGAAVAIVRCCLTALDKLHSRGVVYGDVKPSNIMLSPEGEVKIIDIGSAFQLTKSRKPYFCTPEYAAPEVLESEECTPRSDLASLGYVLIELLIGEPVFTQASKGGTTEHSIAQQATTGIPTDVDESLIEEKRSLPGRLEELLPSYGPILRQFIQKLIAPDPKDRFRNAREAEVEPECGGYVYFKQLVRSDLDSHFQNEFRVWMETLV
jgi:serine/threonine-protein kinase